MCGHGVFIMFCQTQNRGLLRHVEWSGGIDGIWKAAERCGQSDPSCPGLSVPGLSNQTGQCRLLSGLQLASEPIRNWTCHRGTEPWLDTTHVQQLPRPQKPSVGLWEVPLGPRSAARVTPGLSCHVWTRPHTMWEPQRMIRIFGEGGWRKRTRGLWTVAASFFFLCVCVYVVGMATWSETAGPPDLSRTPHPGFPSQMWSSCLRSLCWGPGGRNYTRDDPVLLGLPAFQVGLTFVGRLWFYPPPSVATTELIPLMSSYSDHRIATLHM